MGDLTTLTSAEGATQQNKLSRRFLASIDHNFLTQMMEEPLRKDVLLNFVLTRTEGLVVAVKARHSRGCCEHEIVEFSILYGGNRRANEIAAMDYGKS